MSAPSGQRPETRPRPRPGTFRLGTISGIDITVQHSWFLIVLLIAIVVEPRLEEVEPGLGSMAYLAGVAFAVLLYLSVLLHEVSHAVAARSFQMPVSSINLHFLGGATEIEGEAETPWREFVIAVVGPLTSLAIGGVAYLAIDTFDDGLLRFGIAALAGANLIVGVLNLVPGLPLDGGRVLKAGVWKATGDTHRGTIVAAWGGRVVAVMALGYPVLISRLLDQPVSAIDFIFAGFIAMFLWSGATAALESAKVRSRLPYLVARDLARRTLTVPPELPLAEAVRRAQEVEAGSIVTVTSTGVPIGVVNEAALLSVPADRRAWVPVSSVTRTLDDGLRLPVGIGGEDLIRAISSRPAGEYLLLDADGSIFGVLSTADVDRAFRAHA